MSWPDEDIQAALEWQDYQRSLCTCGVPRDESFDPENQFAYAATAFECFVCAERERAAWADNKDRGTNGKPLFGRFYSVSRRD